MGKRSGDERQRRAHGKAVKAARQARRDRAERKLLDVLRPLKMWRVK